MKRVGDERFSQAKKRDNDFYEYGEFINYVLEPPTLENIALVSIAVSLWQNPDISKGRFECVCDEYKAKVCGCVCDERFEENARKKLEEIPLPGPLKMKVSSIIEPIGKQIYWWIDDADSIYRDLFDIHKKRGLRVSYDWTSDGKIDRTKSISKMIAATKELSLEEKEFRCLYEIACKYCLEQYLPDLWIKMSDKNSALDEAFSDYDLHVIAYWNAVQKDELPTLLTKLKLNDIGNVYDCNRSISVNMVSLSVFLRNIITLEYFWQKLTGEEKSANIENWLEQSIDYLLRELSFPFCRNFLSCADTMFFLLSHLSPQRQREVFQKHSEVILIGLLSHWPLKRFFLPTITLMLDFLQENVYISIMKHIIDFGMEIKRITNYTLREVWHLSPFRLKKIFIQFLTNEATAISNMLITGDNSTIDSILSIASEEEKKLITFAIAEASDIFWFIASKLLKVSTIDFLLSKTLSADCDRYSFKYRLILNFEYLLRTTFSVLDSVTFSLDLHSDDIIYAIIEFVNWVFKTRDFRDFVQNLINPSKVYAVLIHLKSSLPVNKFLKWYFETEEDILNFKKEFVHELKNCENCTSLINSLGPQGAVGWEVFENFLSYAFNSPVEINLFKKSHLHLVRNLVECNCFDFATLFMNWCIDSSQEIKTFRKDLLYSSGLKALLEYINDAVPKWEKVKNILKWFSPFTKAEIVVLKSFFNDEDFEDTSFSSKQILSSRKIALNYLLNSFREDDRHSRQLS